MSPLAMNLWLTSDQLAFRNRTCRQVQRINHASPWSLKANRVGFIPPNSCWAVVETVQINALSVKSAARRYPPVDSSTHHLG